MKKLFILLILSLLIFINIGIQENINIEEERNLSRVILGDTVEDFLNEETKEPYWYDVIADIFKETFEGND